MAGPEPSALIPAGRVGDSGNTCQWTVLPDGAAPMTGVSCNVGPSQSTVARGRPQVGQYRLSGPKDCPQLGQIVVPATWVSWDASMIAPPPHWSDESHILPANIVRTSHCR